MKIEINQRDLSKHISIAQKAISGRSTIDILDSILLEARDNKLRIIGTDLDISIDTNVSCNVIEEGSIVINSRIFGDIIRKLPSEEILITTDESYKMNILCGKSEFNLIGQDPEQYPKLPIVIGNNFFRIQKDILKNAIKQTVFATSQDELRPQLTGVLFEVSNNKVSFVALDGFRLALKTVDVNLDEESEVSIIIPGRTLNEINKIIDDSEDLVKIVWEPGNIIFEINNTTLYSKQLEGQFFNYRDIIRNDHTTSVLVDKSQFQHSLERASLMAKEDKTNLIRLTIEDNRLRINSKSEIGTVDEELDIESSGDDLEIAFNSNYLIEGIKTIASEKISLNFMGSLNPCIIKPLDDENHIYLVLPVRLG